ncbi:hypothetical protein G9P44_004252 [Scheffersomyces stipitis]|nr:hypothetical protein G9P44_004252 [Scheffersomyces stipitis]
MMFKVGLRNTSRIARRNFSSSSRAMNEIYGAPKGGIYSNLPFQVLNRKYIPFSVYFWGISGFFFAFPFLTTFWHLKKSGALDN